MDVICGDATGVTAMTAFTYITYQVMIVYSFFISMAVLFSV
jgi:hypothetical protein